MRRRGTLSTMATESSVDDLASDLARLASSMEMLTMSDAGGRLEDTRAWIVRTIHGYLIPRIEHPSMPITVVFAGPTGVGKSTLLNSVAGGEHSVAGPLRPTTRSPLVLAHDTHAGRYGTIGGVECQVVTGRAPILEELTLVDTPDIDSTSIEHRAIAETMIDNADVVVYVTSASRYADLVPWEVLRRAHSKGVPVINVLNRIRSTTSGALADYSSRLRAEGLVAPVVAVHEHHMARGAQSVPLIVIQELRDSLVDVVEERREGTAHAVDSVLQSVLARAGEVLAEVSETATISIDLTSQVKDELKVDIDRINSRLRPNPGGALDLGPLISLASRMWRTKGMVRRRLPPALAVARSHALVDASLAGAIDTDIRLQLGSESLIGDDENAMVPTNTYTAVGAAVGAWHQDLDGMPMIRGAIDPSLASLLLARFCVESHDPKLEDVLALLKGPGSLAEVVSYARQRLAVHLVPIYTSVEYQVTSRLGIVVSADDAIYRAKVSHSAVVARSSLAHV